MPAQAQVTVSIVSHGQTALVGPLLSDLQTHCRTPLRVILTLNIKETPAFNIAEFGFPIEVVKNAIAKGFAANHNAAFSYAKTDYFCVLNPDIRIKHDPFPPLIVQAANPRTGVTGPLIVDSSGKIEDSARRFPTPASILRKLLLNSHGLDYEIRTTPISPDWIGGMFMMFRSEVFRQMHGFDEGYFLYYEDVDLCWRLRGGGYRVILMPSVRAIHDAQRESHHHIRYLFWHFRSMLRFFRKTYLGQRSKRD